MFKRVTLVTVLRIDRSRTRVESQDISWEAINSPFVLSQQDLESVPS
jgi:hypothetical protein